MFTTILKVLGSLFGFFGKATDYADKKDTENLVKNNYEKEKEIDALKETQKTEDLLDEAENRVEALEEKMDNIYDADMKDASLTEEEVKKELEEISDPEKKEDRAEQIEIAKEIKEEADKKQIEIENDDSFNSGDDFIFRG